MKEQLQCSDRLERPDYGKQQMLKNVFSEMAQVFFLPLSIGGFFREITHYLSSWLKMIIFVEYYWNKTKGISNGYYKNSRAA
ncbi:hypothetical protein [Sunxiuqinia sp. sy24]|uniref:hypothetical protein n=1 Tax=Sunxiuqinia sp. sy24 TaxID=3461495 RepID=UPI004045E05D